MIARRVRRMGAMVTRTARVLVGLAREDDRVNARPTDQAYVAPCSGDRLLARRVRGRCRRLGLAESSNITSLELLLTPESLTIMLMLPPTSSCGPI